MALLLSAQSGCEVTEAQLLGTEKEEKSGRVKDAERAAKKMLRRLARAEVQPVPAEFDSDLLDELDAHDKRGLTSGR